MIDIDPDLLDAYKARFGARAVPMLHGINDLALLERMMREAMARGRPVSAAEFKVALGVDPAGDGATKF